MDSMEQIGILSEIAMVVFDCDDKGTDVPRVRLRERLRPERDCYLVDVALRVQQGQLWKEGLVRIDAAQLAYSHDEVERLNDQSDLLFEEMATPCSATGPTHEEALSRLFAMVSAPGKIISTRGGPRGTYDGYFQLRDGDLREAEVSYAPVPGREEGMGKYFEGYKIGKVLITGP